MERPPSRLALLPWGSLAGLALGALVVAIALYQWSQPSDPSAGARTPREQTPGWMRGFQSMEGVHLTEYSGNSVHWELQSPRGNIRLQRYVFGQLRTHPLLHLFQPKAALNIKGGVVRIEARRVYFDPRKSEWIFVQGEARRGSESRPFQQLHWHPDSDRLEARRTSRRLPLLRFWEPLY